MRRNKLSIFIHFVWRTWDRLPLVTDDIERDLYRYIETVCRDDRCAVLAVNGMPDHVHLVVTLSNTISLADLMRDVKGGSSRFVNEKLKPGQWFEWQANYGAFSVSQSDLPRVIRYVQDQKQHHANGDLWPEFENPTEDDQDSAG